MPGSNRETKFALFGLATSQRFDSSELRLSPQQQQAAQRNSEFASLIDLAQSLTGPGFPLDKKLREFAREFNNRVLMGRGGAQPQSFDVLQAFVEPDDRALLLRILPERFHSLDLDYILEKLTDPTRTVGSENLMALREGEIYHLHIPGSYQGLQFTGNEGLAFYGAAFVRHGEELSILGIAAKEGRETGLLPVDVADGIVDPERAFLTSLKERLDQNHQPFYDSDNLYPLVFLTRIDLTRKTTMVRFILEERKDTWSVYSDSREIYTYMAKDMKQPIERVSDVFELSNGKLIEYSQVFTLLRDIPFAIIDVDDDDNLAISRYPTELNLSKNTTTIRKIRKALSLNEAPNYVDVKSIIRVAPAGKAYNWEAETFKVEQGGYWKALAPGKIGVGKNGDKVHGRSWVTVQESWVESLGFEPTENTEALQVKTTTDTADVGVVYVMRSASHPRDQYKVGFTIKDAYDRANQLYATSGQSDQFNVVEQWHVRSPRRVEALVHQRLAAFRVNPRREFFSLKYDRIRKAIEEAIEDLSAELGEE
ncbi:GIY-YIG nuclease family protein [Rhizobium leguminosarum]|uniref:GIY-YIG nuclease family protein n=1 Tax=Rhizobium leguminosarum TaxID=384 RepID=A0A4Q8Y0E8_RHILE|nr:GIY-YIG nuclease family protein [Rhizobium leguminosarum]TAX72811.1 GIY-YIG nuclease family protein [Rhizobium leguminosarum]